MNNQLTELVFIIDRSGSMNGLESDTIGGYNALLHKQRGEHGQVNVTTVLFDDEYELLHNCQPLHTVKPITEQDYYVRGCTALLDAVGRTIHDIGHRLSATPEPERPARVLFVITTDGLENASQEYSYHRVQEMITHQKTHYSWEFIFLGANIDAVAEAARLGIPTANAVQCCADAEGTALNYRVLAEAVCCYCEDASLSLDWKDEIEADFRGRGSRR